MLEMEHVTFRYSKETPVILSDVSVSLGKGEFIAVTGRNGSGKTTVTRLLTGLERPTEGRIIYNGKNITDEGAAKKKPFYRLCISTAGAANVHAYCSGRNWFRPLSAGEAWQ